MKVGTQQAAELTGKSRSTIHRAIKSGKLPAEENPSGEKMIEVAELKRVYGLVKSETELPQAANKSQLGQDPHLVYPSLPPKSPHFCWLNLLLGGIAQIIFGQVPKGVALLAATLLLWLVELGWIVSLLSLVDAYMVGKVLESGRPVGKWKFFPT